MSRPPLEPIAVKASADLFTALLAIAFAAVLIGTVIFVHAGGSLVSGANQHLWSN